MEQTNECMLNMIDFLNDYLIKDWIDNYLSKNLYVWKIF